MDTSNLNKSMFKKIFLITGIILIGGLSGIITDRYFFPYLITTHFFSKNEFLKKASENVTVINKTEQVYIKEESSIAGITNQITPAIVNIVSYVENSNTSHLQKKIIQTSNNTGEILTSDGIIIANAKIIIPNGKYKIILNNGSAHEAKILGVDKWSNLAFLKITASNLPVISFGNSDEYNPGEKLIAISNNGLEHQNRFTTGLLSSFDPFYNISGEALSKSETIEGVFLSDFSEKILSESSLIIDYSGKAIGITGSTIKNGNLEYFQIPSNKIKLALEKAINNELDSNVFLGAYYLSLNKSLALANDLTNEKGALIYSASGQQGLAVISGSPAEKAGLKIGDVLIKVDNFEINVKNNLSDILYKYKKGDRAEFTILRSGQEIKISVQF